ncbi:hypothetical protein AVEN_47561-1 [Araneus ventricosus]|uniref:Uncharacterized protein n=1 Tax=Araneus ventricosus TaxID=182803 RepID=A0A4Y2NIX9_ARAVE|nr:hypothetical protein AVEN_47561-1 [Araneus ventricosus]
MEFSRTVERIFFPNRDIEKKVAFSGIIDFYAMIAKFVTKLPKCSPSSARHSMLTPVELLPNFKTNEAAKRYHIFVTVYTSLLLIIRKKNISPSTLIRIRAARMKATENDESFPTRVILSSRFEATRRQFWDGPRNLNLGQMTRTTPELAPLSPNFHATPTGGRLTTTYNLTCNGPHTRRIFSGIGFRTWRPSAPKPRPYH